MRKPFKLLFTLLILAKLIIATEVKNEVEDDGQCTGNQKESICITPGCVHAASEILKTMDESVDPCDNFYEFTCGKFLKATIIPDDKLTIMKITDINDRIQEQIRTMLEEPTKPEESRPFKLIKNYYNTCMNTTAIEEDNLGTVKLLLNELGGWPVLDKNWNEKDFDWKNSIYKLRKAGFTANYFLEMGVGADSRNSSIPMLGIDQASLAIGREYLVQGFESKLIHAAYDYIVDIAVIFGADKEYASKELEESVKFLIELAKITLPQEERRNFTALTNFMRVAELQEKFPSIPWLEYINNFINIPEIKVSGDETIDVTVPKFLGDLEALLTRTSKRVQANFIISSVIYEVSDLLTNEVRNRLFELKKLSIGTQQMPPRWKFCVSAVSEGMKTATGALYVRKYFNEEAKNDVIKLISNLRDTFIDMLKQVEWMDDNTRSKSIEKAAAMVDHIAYPQEFLDDKKLEEHYSELKPSENYFQSVLNNGLFKIDNSFKKLRKPVNKTDWLDHSSVTEVNAFYNLMENSITLPAGILQDPVYKDDRPNYMNYGGLGFIIGHEITHGFDDRGRQLTKDGVLANWWEDATLKSFVEKAQCIIDQYSSYTSPEIHMKLNGINTQGENIADNGGIKEAYLAYNSWVERNGEELRLPGLHYTPKQMFWISAANAWCSKERNEYTKVVMLASDHPPSYFRIIGAFSNSEHFAKDFNCPVGSKMNPKHKCHVW